MKTRGVCASPRPTVAFYEKAFGPEMEMMDDRKQFVMMRAGETTMHLASEEAAATTGVSPRVNRAGEPTPAWQVAFVADDVDAG